MLLFVCHRRVEESNRVKRLVLDKRLEDNDRALELAFNNGMEFISNIQAANDIRLLKQTETETALNEGK